MSVGYESAQEVEAPKVDVLMADDNVGGYEIDDGLCLPNPRAEGELDRSCGCGGRY